MDANLNLPLYFSKILDRVRKEREITLEPKVQVTPAIAKYLLKNNSKNRSLRKNHVNKLVAYMQNNDFNYVAFQNPIRLSKDMELMDGQHRLEAVVKSGLSQFFDIVFNANFEEINSIDGENAKRSLKDGLDMAGEKNTSTLAAAILFVHNIRTKKFSDAGISVNRSKTFLTRKEQLAFKDENPFIIEACTVAIKVYNSVNTRVLSTREIAGFYFYITQDLGNAKGKVYDFLHKVVTCENVENKSIEKKLYEWLLQQKTFTHFKIQPTLKYSKILEAFELVKKGKSGRSLRDLEFVKTK